MSTICLLGWCVLSSYSDSDVISDLAAYLDVIIKVESKEKLGFGEDLYDSGSVRFVSATLFTSILTLILTDVALP